MRTSQSDFPVAGESENRLASLSNSTNGKKHGVDLNCLETMKNFLRAVSVESLKRARFMLKSNQGTMSVGTSRETLSGISNHWFEATSKKLLDGSFKYSNRRRVLIDKPDGGERPLTIANPRIKVIERALPNPVEPIFEGLYQWEDISKKEYDQRKGVAQGSILSSFLFNIYLHEFDKKIASIQKTTYATHQFHESAIYGNIEAEKAYRKIFRNFVCICW